MSRKGLAAGILAAWLVTLGLLIRREYLQPRGALLADQPLNISPGATYYRIELGGEQIGFASSTVDTIADTLRLQEVLLMQIPALGTVQRVEARTAANLSRTLRLRSFTATVRSGDTRFGAHGAVSDDSVLVLDIETAGDRRTVRTRLAENTLLPGLVPMQLAFGGELAVGLTRRFQTIDPLTLAARPLDVSVVAESTFVIADSADQPEGQTAWIPARWDTVRAWKVLQNAGGLELVAWIDDLGQIVEATTAAGFRLERTAYEIAYENFQRGEAVPRPGAFGSDVIRSTAIAADARLEPEGLDVLRVRLTGVALEGFDLAGGRQRLVGDTLTVTREGAQLLRAAYFLPYEQPDLAPYLAPEPLVQSDDPRIQAQARQIVGRLRNPRLAVERLNAWVFENLDKQITVSVPSAVDVLEHRRGDCNEHTVLFVALARAVGIPARTAAGLVYLQGRFYYHAWPEVYLGDWVAVDPTFGQMPADAAHLRFTIGGLARQVELIRLIGRLTIAVVERTPE